MSKRLLVILLCLAMLFTMAACKDKKKEAEEKAKAEQEEAQKKAEQEVIDSVVEPINSLPDEVTLEDKDNVEGIRAKVDALSEEQLALVPADAIERLEAAEARIRKLEKRKAKKDKKKDEDRAAASEVTKKIEALPTTITAKDESTISGARKAYNALSEDQKKLVDESSLKKLRNAENALSSVKEKEAKAKEEAEKKAETKKETKKKSQTDDKYAIAKKYVGKKATALVAKIGKPKKKTKNPNCGTDGEEYFYYYDGFYVGVLSQTMDDPLIVQNVTKN